MLTNKASIESFQDRLVDFYNKRAAHTHWRSLLELCLKKKTAKPNNKWSAAAKELLTQLPKEELSLLLQGTFIGLKDLIREVHQLHKDGGTVHFLNDRFIEMTKGFIWISGMIEEEALQKSLEDLALWAYKKIPGHGPLAAKLGNAILYAFSLLPFEKGVVHLSYLRMKIQYPNVRNKIDAYMEHIATQAGKTVAEMEEITVPDFGLSPDGIINLQLDETYKLQLQIESVSKVSLLCFKNGQPLKSIPSSVKTQYKNKVTALRHTAKELKVFLALQRQRIEALYLKERQWTFEEWYPLYIGHPLVGAIAQKLIWHFRKGDRKATAIYQAGKWLNAQSEKLDWIGEGCKVQLWHPIGFEADYVLAWRKYLSEALIQQPFKQAFREVYIVTDAELATGNYSNRFAAHILRQHQMAALCKVRGWQYQMMGNWDSSDSPIIYLPHWDIRAEFWVECDWNGETTPSGVFQHVFTDQVRFYYQGRQMDMVEVPAIVFSELMRDVDLFVGVSSIGNDPNWQDGGNERFNHYWRDYSFGELSQSSKVRKEVLENLIPRLKIASRCSFSGRYLIVRGDLKTYKIHIGSGNILMQPNDQYLCIVPSSRDNKPDKLFLPFEGDRMLSIIISKAFLLAEDRKIKDPTILSQLIS